MRSGGRLWQEVQTRLPDVPKRANANGAAVNPLAVEIIANAISTVAAIPALIGRHVAFLEDNELH